MYAVGAQNSQCKIVLLASGYFGFNFGFDSSDLNEMLCKRKTCLFHTPLLLVERDCVVGGMECSRQTSINWSVGRNSEAFSSSPYISWSCPTGAPLVPSRRVAPHRSSERLALLPCRQALTSPTRKLFILVQAERIFLAGL